MGYHKDLTGADLHEPKDIENAASGEIYVADGLGSGSYTKSFVPLLENTDTQWTDYTVSLIGVSVPAGLTAPTLTKINDNGAGSTGVYAQGFSATVENEIAFNIELPHGYKRGTIVKPHVHWVPSTTNTGNVVWGLEYCISNTGVTAAATTILTATVASAGVLKNQQYTALGDIPGTDLKESTVINCRLFRKAADAADTFTGVAVALVFGVHYEINKFGTDDEAPAA